jgi:putative FmdB family regulatory protein
MPVYEYRCSDCNREFEYQQRMSEDAKTVCEACGGKLERMISKTAFQLKGAGWYKDLYASAKPEGGDAKPAAKKADAAGDASSSAPAPAAAAAAPSSSGGDSSGSSGGGSSSGGGGTGTSSGGGSAAAASAAK